MKNILQLMILTGALFLLPACKDNLELNPQNSLDGSAGYQTKSDLDGAILGCYNSFQSGNYYGLRYFALADLYAGSLSHTGTFPSFAQFANKALLADNTEINNIWNSIYVGVNRSNAVLAAIPGIKDATFNAKAAEAEAKLLRAFHYFNLLQAFGWWSSRRI